MNLTIKMAMSRLQNAAPLAVALVMAGCSSTQHAYDPINPAQPFVFPGQTAGAPLPTPPASGAIGQGQIVGSPAPHSSPSALPVVIPSNSIPLPPQRGPTNLASTLRVGDWVTVSFTDIPNPQMIVDQKIQIGEDGAITLPLNVRLQAVGKTPRALEQEIRGEYVPRYYKFLTVTVKTDQRAFFVGGEVKVPNRLPYVGDITVLRAIQSAGDFTDFANRKKIELRRDNGERHEINWYKAIKDPKLDLLVYPNDQIIVHKRSPFSF